METTLIWEKSDSGNVQPEDATVDLIVYGATPGGVCAACVAAEEGLTVRVIDSSPVVGGHWTNGICTTECEHMLPITFGGWMMKLLRRFGAWYGIDAPLHRWEPHVAQRIMEDIRAEHAIAVELNARILRVRMGESRRRRVIDAIELSTGAVYGAHEYIDCSYEGDLMAAAGVSYRVGRESRDEYGESLAGIRFIDSLDEVRNTKGHAMLIDEIWEVDLSKPGGGLIEGVEAVDPGSLQTGAAHHLTMNYHFRATVSSDSNRVPFPRPDGYREERFEMLKRYIASRDDIGFWDIVGALKHPSGHYMPGEDNIPGYTGVEPGTKWEINNKQASVLSLGHLGGQAGFPDGSWDDREAIITDHYEHNAGLLHFLEHSTEIPRRIRDEAHRWGLAADEYTTNGNWPWRPYIRETRRMVGQHVMTQHDVLHQREKPDNILWNSHWIDSHHVRRVALDDKHFRNEGRIWKELVQPYAVPYRALLPRREEVANLLVPGCLSATHVAFSSVRLESTWIGLGEAAACAAAQAQSRDLGVAEISVADLQRRLRRRGITL